MLSPFPPPNTLTSYPQPQHPPCPLSQGTTIGGGLPPSIPGARRWHLRLARGSADSVWLCFHRYLLHTRQCMDLTPILPPTQRPCMQHHHHTLTPSTRRVSELCKIVSTKYSSQSSIHTSLTAAWALPSVNLQPWRFTNNSLGLPPAHSLSVCLFLWVCVVCGARGSEAQRAEAVARHQGRSTPGGGIIGLNIRGLSNFFMIPGVYLFFHDIGGLTGIIWDYLGLSGIIWDYLRLSGIIWDKPPKCQGKIR